MLQLRGGPWISPRSQLSLGLAALAAATVLTLSTPAPAMPLLPLVNLSGNVRWLYGSGLGDQAPDPTHGGIGLSAGLTLPQSVYLGASLDYFLGADYSATWVDNGGGVLGRTESSASSFQLLAHAGYDLGLLMITLRPSLGLGWWHTGFTGSGCGVPCTDPGFANLDFNWDDLVFSPGLELFYGFGLLNLNAEARFNKVLSSRGADADSTFFGLGVGVNL